MRAGEAAEGKKRRGGGEGPKGERGWATQEWDPNVGGGPPAAVQPEEKRDERGEKGETQEKQEERI